MPISDIQPGEAYTGFARVYSAEAKTASTGKPYAAYTLQDISGSISTNHWDCKPADVLPVGSFVKFGGQGELYKEKLQFRLNQGQFRLVEDRDNFDRATVIPSAPEPPDAMLNEVRETIAAMADTPLRTLTSALIEEAADQILLFPAAQSMHHATLGGLLHHSLFILRLAKHFVPLYPFLNPDLLYAGIIIHDIGKIEEMVRDSSGLVTGYSTPGKLLGHIQLGLLRIERTAIAHNIPPETALLLQHMILAHHGKPEWGSPIGARFPEAEILSTLDLLDARLYEMNQALDSIPPDSFSQKIYAIDNRELYRIPK